MTQTATSTQGQSVERTTRLVGSLAQRMTRRDTTALAALRRAMRHLPDVPDARVWAYVAPYVGENDDSLEAGLALAALWAHWHNSYITPQNGRYNLGGMIRRALPADKHQQAYNTLAVASWATIVKTLAPLIKSAADAHIAPDWSSVQRDLLAFRRGDTQTALRRIAASLFNPAASRLAPASVAAALGESPQTTTDTTDNEETETD